MESTRKSYKIVIERKAEKQLKSLSKNDYLKIRVAIDKLAENPRGHNSIKLTDTENEYRMRVGDFRVLYTIEDHVLHIYVFEVVNRKDAYR
ncbi:MAG: type toxin-antitoxin system mRNA interferase toxin, RelE/StbE family [Flavipsychrobacter sp.]|nr:type toxin-antitoxin system mRNA interferase toxin, RelE/StbE family [Flavipsychrobacter sp.]